MTKRYYRKAVSILGSKLFFYASILVYALETSWIAISGRYSMAYDENTHLGIIQVYAKRFLPFWSEQPQGVDHLGAFVRDPSYLWHFGLSFPYRLFAHYVHSEMAQVIFLRFSSVLFFGLGIVIYRRLMLKVGASKPIANTVTALFILTPLIPFLAAQLNYDNLLFPLSGLVFMYALRVSDQLHQQKKVVIKDVLLLAVFNLVGCLVMYSFLPILVFSFLWGLVLLVRLVRAKGLQNVYHAALKDFAKLGLVLRVGLVGLFVLLAGLFAERYIVNIVRYHSPLPSCQKVLSVERCMAYGPFKRDFESHRDKVAGALPKVASDPVSYTFRDWLRIMSFQLFFSLNGQIDNFKVGEPLILPRIAAIVFGVLGAGLVIWYRKYLRRHYKLTFLVLGGLFYTLVLWQREYNAFLHSGYAVAVQTRYLMAYIPILYLVYALAFSRWLRTRPRLKPVLAWGMIALLLLQGGGATVFIVRSNTYWYWPTTTIQKVNQNAQKIMKTFVVGS